MEEPTLENDMPNAQLDLVSATKDIVTAYVQHNNLNEDRVSAFIENVHASLSKISGGATAIAPDQEPSNQEPAVPIKKSITPDYLVCLEDGKRLKIMTRYLRTRYNMTPEDYRKKWGLPHDYPMTAPNYSKKRSDMAHGMGLGKMRKKRVSRSTKPSPAMERLSQEV